MTDMLLPLRIDTIAEFVADEVDLPVEFIRRRRCFRDITHPRQMVMALSRDVAKRSLQEIANYFGGMHHTTVLHGHRAAVGRLGYAEMYLIVATYEAQRHARIGERWAL
jgi:chromosomal replication initiation ATPase DnaA